MAKPVNTTLDFGGFGGIIGLPNATAPQSPATLAQVNALVEGLAWKDNAVVATQANINLLSPGATVDGITMVAGDRMVVRAQTAGAENGIYIWNGAAVAATRSIDASTIDELKNATLTVDQGTSAATTYRQSVITGVLDTIALNFAVFGTSAPAASETVPGIAELATQVETDAGTDDLRIVTPLKLKNFSGLVKRASVTFGDGTATQYTLNHNLNTRDIIASIKQVATPFAEIMCDVEATTLTAITVRFASPPALNSLRATVMA